MAEIRAAMEVLAGQFAPEALRRIGFQLYEQFRLEVPADLRGWGAQGALALRRAGRATATQTKSRPALPHGY